MARKKKIVNRDHAREVYRKVQFDQHVEKRAMRASLNQIENEKRLASLPAPLLRKLRAELSQPDHNKKRIARAYGLPHAFIIWLWRHE